MSYGQKASSFARINLTGGHMDIPYLNDRGIAYCIGKFDSAIRKSKTAFFILLYL